MRYHLGCGGHYLSGYYNVNFPSERHEVNTQVKADLYADVLEMSYEPCDEIRCHHMFEHFSYVDSMFLLRQWTLALQLNGCLWVDVPDVEALAKALCSSESIDKDFKIVRYLYGSHESNWAYHINGWTPRMLSNILELIGYGSIEIQQYGNPHSNLPNCGVHVKGNLLTKISPEGIDQKLLDTLSKYMNGNTDFEQSLVRHLCAKYKSRIGK